jgi:hypothetical protein
MSFTDPDSHEELASFYSPMVKDMSDILSSLSAYHTAISSVQQTYALLSLGNTSKWLNRQTDMIDLYLLEKSCSGRPDLARVLMMDMNVNSDGLHTNLQQMEEHLLMEGMDMADKQLKKCRKLMEKVAEMTSKLGELAGGIWLS